MYSCNKMMMIMPPASSSTRRTPPSPPCPAIKPSRLLLLLLALTSLMTMTSAFFYAPLKHKALQKLPLQPVAVQGQQGSISSSSSGSISSTTTKITPPWSSLVDWWLLTKLKRGGQGCGCGGATQGGCGCGAFPNSRTALSSVASMEQQEPQQQQQQQVQTAHKHQNKNKKASRDVHVVAVIPGNGARGQTLNASWTEVMEQMHRRLQYMDPSFSVHVVTEEDVLAHGQDALTTKLPALKGQKPDILYLLGLQNPALPELLNPYLDSMRHIIALDSLPALERQSRIGPARPYGPLAALWRFLPVPTRRKQLLTLFDTAQGFWERGHSDDIMYMIAVVINGVVKNIPAVSEILKPLTFQALQCMVTKCGQQIIDCQKNPQCKASLQCLDRCPPNDQVCRYRCIIQYESKEFEQFALCILQKHNCLNNHAVMPALPDPVPMTHFRGEPLTHEMAAEITFGHLGQLGEKLPWSWKVIGGQNAAYDLFPNQYQIFYRKAKQLWYQPVFQVKTLDGRTVWRRRLYRVRYAKTPGTFYFTVLDNGVTSAEYWRILDVDDNLEWVLLYYSGAAAAAGQSYAGAILASPSGGWPPHPERYMDRIRAGLDRAGIKEWELFKVHHDGSEGAPLEIDPLAEPRFKWTGGGAPQEEEKMKEEKQEVPVAAATATAATGLA